MKKPFVRGVVRALETGSAMLKFMRSFNPKRTSAVEIETPTFQYAGFQIPNDLALLTGGAPEDFAANAEGQFAEVRDKVGIEPGFSFLEIGCGIGRLAIPLAREVSDSEYLGIDIIAPSIEWATQNITARHPNFKFLRHDIKDDLHNPTGTLSSLDVRIPVADQSIDRVVLWSVFTHLFRDEIVHYLKEFRRVLKPGGKVWASCFVLTPEVLASARKNNLTKWSLHFSHPPDTHGCFINVPEVPRGAVGYSPDAWREMIAMSGLKMLSPFIMGQWSGHYQTPESGQDGIILG